MKRIGLLLTGALFVLTGCLGKDQTARSQIDADADKAGTRTVGEVSEFQTSGGVPVSGVGLVVELEGTGGDPPPGEYRRIMEEYLKQSKVENPKEWLESKNNALVIVSGEIPPGTRRGDLIDVSITLPPGSKVKSLRNGKLLPTPLRTYSSTGQVREYLKQNELPTVSSGDSLLKGHILADAQGPLQVTLKDRESDRVLGEDDLPEGGVKQAWVWKGARAKADQPYFLVLNPGQQNYRKAIIIADRINEVFHGPGATDKIAVARGKENIVLNVPPQYRANPPHFLRVIRMIPEERTEGSAEYRAKLTEDLKQPETTLAASLRLEALGRGSIPTLRSVLRSSGYPLVRFGCAEALAYLGEPIAAAELAKLAENHPTLQAYCLTALASLDEAASSEALQDLLGSPIAEVRYGAFRALREIDPRADAARGYKMNNSFWLHLVAPSSLPVVHLLSNTRAEIVLFGQTPSLTAPFSLRAGPDIVVTAKRGDKSATISRFSTNKPQRQEQCSFAVADIIKKMAEMKAQYSDVARMLVQARDIKALSCELAIDALPNAVPIQVLADNAIVDKKMEKEAELLKTASPDKSETANVFDRAEKR